MYCASGSTFGSRGLGHLYQGPVHLVHIKNELLLSAAHFDFFFVCVNWGVNSVWGGDLWVTPLQIYSIYHLELRTFLMSSSVRSDLCFNCWAWLFSWSWWYPYFTTPKCLNQRLSKHRPSEAILREIHTVVDEIQFVWNNKKRCLCKIFLLDLWECTYHETNPSR